MVKPWIASLKRWMQPCVDVIDIEDAAPKQRNENVVVVTTYDKLVRGKDVYRTYVGSVEWRCVVCDEAHYLCSSTTKRTQFVALDEQSPVRRAHRSLFISGTP